MEAFNDTLIFNRATLLPSSDQNQYQYNWPGAQTFKDTGIAVKTVSIPYSWKNITAAYGNNTFQIKWPLAQLTGTTTSMTTITVTIPDGNYGVDGDNSLNAFLQQYCIDNDLYLVDSTGSYVYFISCQPNSVYYSVEFDFYPIPLSANITTALPALPTAGNYAYPASWPTNLTGYTSYFTPQMVVPVATTTNSWSSYIGYAAGTYPTLSYDATAAVVGVQSTFAPQVSPVQSIIMGLSIVTNRVGLNPTVISCFGISNTTYGQNIIYQPSAQWYSKVLDGTFNSVTLTFYDQDFNAIPIYDPNINVEFALIKNFVPK
jgi:hypothetical protein